MKYKNAEEASLMAQIVEYLHQKKYNMSYDLNIESLSSVFENLIMNRDDKDNNIKYYFSYMNRDLNELIGKIAFFPDMALINKSVEDAFGVIVAARNTKTWTENLYFVKRPHIKTLGAFTNTSPIIVENIRALDYENYFKNEDVQDVANRFLNSYCTYTEGENKHRAYVKNFGFENIGLEIIKDTGEVFKEIELPISLRNTSLSDLSDDVGDITFGITIKNN